MAKKNKDKIDDFDDEFEEKEKSGNKFLTTAIVFFIVIIWLGIFALLIKADIGGFGSGVLRPLLKDVPVINKILPAATDEEFFDENNTSYSSLEEAVARIKELEAQLADEDTSSSDYEDKISDLEKQIEKLQVYKDNADELEARIKEFDENVVFNDNAPDVSEYQKYYQQIDPDNAEEIYRQVVEQMQYDEKMQAESDKYAKMDPSAAAQVLEIMSADDLDTVCGILYLMSSSKSAEIMNELDPATAAKITKALTTYEE